MMAQTETSKAITHPGMNRAVFVLSLVGVLIAGYLWWAHSSGADIPCGPSGDCNAVAQSPYSRLLGIPVAAFGAVGYFFLAALAFARTLSRNPAGDRRLQTMIALVALPALVVSLYLTYLEVFVIGRLCRWCLASQIVILLLFTVATLEWRRMRRTSDNL